jgi:hypothetical protein
MLKKKNKGIWKYNEFTNMVYLLFVFFIGCANPEENKMDKSKDVTLVLEDVKNVGVTTHCNIEKVKYLDQNIYNAQPSEILSFLLTLSKECRNNVEFMEYSNEVLFTVLNSRTEVVINLVKSNKEIEMEEFFHYLRNPINDNIEPQQIVEKLNLIENDSLKIKMLNALNRE